MELDADCGRSLLRYPWVKNSDVSVRAMTPLLIAARVGLGIMHRTNRDRSSSIPAISQPLTPNARNITIHISTERTDDIYSMPGIVCKETDLRGDDIDEGETGE